MNLKNAIQTVNVELKKIKNEISQWHTDREQVFKDLKTVWQAEYEKVMSEAKKNTKDIASYLKLFEKFNDKTIDVYAKKILSINISYQAQTKGIPKSLAQMVSSYLSTVKESSFGVGVKAKDKVSEDLKDWIFSECHKEFDATSLTTQLSKKLDTSTKSLTKTATNEEEHLLYMARVDFFTSKMLESIDSSFNLSKAARKSIENSDLTSQMLYELEVKSLSNKVLQILDELQNVSPGQLSSLAKTYGTSADDSSLARSKLAMKGVKESLSYFKRDFEDSILEDMDSSGMNSMYLNDMRDHLNLGKACLIDDCVAIDNASDMDTASRELIHDSLYNYLNSQKFFDKHKEQKKSKSSKKIKP